MDGQTSRQWIVGRQYADNVNPVKRLPAEPTIQTLRISPNARPGFVFSAGCPQRKLCSIGTREHTRPVPS